MLVKWNPYTEVERSFDNFFRRPFSLTPYWDDQKREDMPWRPSVNVREDKENLTVEVELPGIDMKDVDLSVKNHVLEIRGERKAGTTEDHNGYHLREVRCGKFSRTFKLPSYVDEEKVKAAYDRGILTITVPRHEKAKPRVIEIEAK